MWRLSVKIGDLVRLAHYSDCDSVGIVYAVDWDSRGNQIYVRWYDGSTVREREDRFEVVSAAR
jgi:hypothetical protein